MGGAPDLDGPRPLSDHAVEPDLEDLVGLEGAGGEDHAEVEVVVGVGAVG